MSTVKEKLSAVMPGARKPAEPQGTVGVLTVEPAQVPKLDQLRVALRARFRLPTEDDTPPANARLLGMAFWAAACAFGGVLPAGRLMAEYLFGSAPQWYIAATIVIGIVGTSLIAAAFASIHRAFLPWYLLSAATILLAANIALFYAVP